ncbi:MAG: gluconokinase [Acidobacteria bacterium]|nr:gluconokinase [Acidobacteriota bacterium]
MSKPVILAIDIGSSSVRAGLYGYDAKPLKGLAARREWSFTSTRGGGSELDPKRAFAVVRELIDEVLSRSATKKIEITRVAMCSFWHSLMGIDARGNATTPVLGWADTRSGAYSAELKKRFDEHAVHNRTGAHFHSSFWPAKLMWLRNERPEAFARTAKWIGFGDYVAMRLTGECMTSISMASATGIFDQRKYGWDGELLRYLKIKRGQLPRIAACGDSFQFTRRVLKRWPHLKNATLFPAIGDGAADHVGSCGIGKQRASLMVGTSAAMRVAYEGEPPREIPQGLWCYRIDDKRVIIGGALSDGGNLYEWCRHRFAMPADPQGEILRRDPKRPLPTVLPFFHGERSTRYREDARGAILDLKPWHDGVDVLEAAMLAVAELLGEVYKRLKRVSRVQKVVASGGALRDSKVWKDIISDVLGIELLPTSPRESALDGLIKLTLEHKKAPNLTVDK